MPAAPESRLIQLLRDTPGLADLLPALHAEALAAVDGTASVLLVLDERSRQLHPISGYRVAALPLDPWLRAPEEARALRQALNGAAPVVLADLQSRAPELAGALEAPAALLAAVPVTGADPGVLIVGLDAPRSPDALDALGPVVAAFGLALERARLEREVALQRELRDLLRDFAQASADTLDVDAGLSVLCKGVVRLFAADSAALWLHDRRSRELVRRATWGTAGTASETRVSVEDALSVAATTLRRDGAELVIGGDRATALSAPAGIAIPLRGRRRALGTLVIEGVRVEPGSIADVLARADELGRQLAAAIENVQLLGDVLASRQQLEDVFDALADLVLLCDPELQITRANQAFASRAGVPRTDLADRPLADFVSAEWAEWLRRVSSGPETPAAATVVVDDRLGGTFAVTATPVRQPAGGRGFLAVVARDVSRDREIEGVHTDLNSRLLQTEKLAALGQFVAGIAHELNNPLQGVLGHLELLRSTGAIAAPLRREIRLIYREAQRAARIVRDLLLFAGPHGIKRRRVSVRMLLNSVASLRTDELKRRNIELVVEQPPDLPAVDGNALLLQQALLNVLVNAEQAIGSHGRIRMRAEAGGGLVTIAVSDTGPGITTEVLPRVFEPFFTARRAGEGTGLGLAVVYGIVRHHGGTVTAANAAEGGAVFTITLPIHRPGGKMGDTRDP